MKFCRKLLNFPPKNFHIVSSESSACTSRGLATNSPPESLRKTYKNCRKSVVFSSSARARGLHTSSRLLWDEYDTKKYYDQNEDMWRRTWEALTFDFKRYKRRYEEAKYDVYKRKGLYSYTRHEALRYELFPFDVDFLIIGGGIMGSSIGWWLKQRVRDEDLKVVILENDDTFTKGSTVLSTGGIRSQFNHPENVEMSLFASEFLRHAGEHLRILDSEPPDIDFIPMGFLFLARTQEEAKEMEENWKMQTHMGAKVALLSKDELTLKFPFMNFDDVIIGSIGLEGEGVIDTWQLLGALREKNVTLGVQYIKAKVEKMMFRTDFTTTGNTMGVWSDEYIWQNRQMTGVYVRPQKTDAAPRPIRSMAIVNAAGPWAGEIASLAHVGRGKGLMAIPVPVVPRKRYVYVVHCPEGPGLDMPYVVDPSGVWCRREDIGHLYICGKTPTQEEDAAIDHSNLDVDYEFFYDKIWPVLAKRIPSFEKLKIKSAWAAYHDYNQFDQNPIIGNNLHFKNFFQISGFSGQNVQHSIAAGRAFMEHWYDGAYKAINLRKFSQDRILKNKPLKPEFGM